MAVVVAVEIIGLICEPWWTINGSFMVVWLSYTYVHSGEDGGGHGVEGESMVGQWRRCKGGEEGKKHLFIYFYKK